MKIHIHSLSILVSIVTLVIAEVPSSTNSYLSDSDRTRLKKVIEPGFNLKDISALHYAVLGYTLMGTPITKSAEICKYILQSAGDGSSLTAETAYYIITTWKTLKTCQALPVAAVTKTITAVIEKDSSTIPELHYAVSSLTALSQKLSEATIAKLVKTLQTALAKDDNLQNLGYTFHIAANFGPGGAFAFGRMEDAIVQADEINGRILQFEGGLSTTSLLVNGIFKLSSSLKKKPPLTSQQIVKLTNYLLSRRSVQIPKGVVALLSTLEILATNEFEKPICIALAENGNVVSMKQPLLRVKACDILGNPLSTTPNVVANSATTLGNDVIISKKNFQPSATDKTLFTMNLMDIKPDRGFYKISVSAGSVSNTVMIKVLTEVTVDYLEVGTADADQTTQPKLLRISYPEKLEEKIEADSQQKLVMRFLLRDSITKKAMRVHQAFVRLFSVAEPGKEKRTHEIIFVAEPDAFNVYKFDMPVGTAAKNFGHQSGDYNVELIVGDAVLSNSFQWNVGTVNLKFPDLSATEVAEKSAAFKEKQNLYQPKPEIKHMFREPEKRPPTFVSNLFTGLCLAPVLLLLILWAKLGVNVSNFPFSLSAIVFHVGLGGIFVLFGIFWLKLNMFVTLRYLLGFSIVTFLAGNKLLSQIAHTHKQNR